MPAGGKEQGRCYWKFPSLLRKGRDNPQLVPASPHRGRDTALGNGTNLQDLSNLIHPCNLLSSFSFFSLFVFLFLFILGLGCARGIWQILGAVDSRDWHVSLSAAQGTDYTEKCLIPVWLSQFHLLGS